MTHPEFVNSRRWFRGLLLLGVTALLFASSVCAQQARYFTYEYTRQSGELIDFYNLVDAPQTVTVTIYNPDGSVNINSPQSISLRGYESETEFVSMTILALGHSNDHDRFLECRALRKQSNGMTGHPRQHGKRRFQAESTSTGIQDAIAHRHLRLVMPEHNQFGSN